MSIVVYHMKPREMVGTMLYPLNQMHEIQPDIYEQHVKKYVGREELLERRVPILDCLWNDVLHTSPVHPSKIRDALMALTDKWKPRTWFEIDIEQAGFTSANCVIYHSRHTTKGDFSVLPDQFEALDIEQWDELTLLPQATKDHYAEAIANGAPVFAFHCIPHILYQGTIDTEADAVQEIML